MASQTDIQPLIDNFEGRRLGHMAASGFDCEGFRLPTPLGDTYAMVGGEGSPPRLLIHGGLADGSIWAPIAGAIRGRVVVADRPGHGLSYRVDYREEDSFRDAAAIWVRDVADALEEEHVDVVANSMGGFFGIAFAAAYPDRIRRLVLVGCPAGLDIDIPLWFRLWGNPVTSLAVRRLKIKDVDQYRKAVLPAAVAHPERVPYEQSEIEFAAGNQPNFDLAAHTMFRSLTTLRGWRRDQLLESAIRKMATPTLFVWGEHDQNAAPERGDAIAADMADAQMVVVPDAGHVPWGDEPAIVARAINDFLDDDPELHAW